MSDKPTDRDRRTAEAADDIEAAEAEHPSPVPPAPAGCSCVYLVRTGTGLRCQHCGRSLSAERATVPPVPAGGAVERRDPRAVAWDLYSAAHEAMVFIDADDPVSARGVLSRALAQPPEPTPAAAPDASPAAARFYKVLYDAIPPSQPLRGRLELAFDAALTAAYEDGRQARGADVVGRLRTIQAMMNGRANAGHPSVTTERHLRELHSAVGHAIEDMGGEPYVWD